MSDITKTRGRFCQRLTPHPKAGVRIMYCLSAYNGVCSPESVLEINSSDIYLGVPEENLKLEVELADIAKIQNNSRYGVVIIHDVKDFDKIVKLEQEFGFWIDGTHEYENIIQIEDEKGE